MQMVPYSFNGTVINGSSDYDAWIERGAQQGQPTAEAQYIKRPGAWPVYTGKDYQPTYMIIKIGCKHDYAELWENLNRLFYTGDQEPHPFIVKDQDDSDAQYQVYATPSGTPTFGNDGPNYTVKLAFDDPIWQGITLQSSTWAIIGTTDSTTITPAGNVDIYPVFEITPTQAPSTDYRYMAFVRVLPQSDNPWVNRPLDVTGSTGIDTAFNTANYVSTGQMRSDGNDLRVFVNGNEKERWFTYALASTDTFSTSTFTRVWVTLDMPPAREMTLLSSLGSTDTALRVPDTFPNRKFVQDCPAEGWLVLDSSLGSSDSEDVHYSGRVITDNAIGFTLDARGQRDTDAISHAAAANVRFMPYDIRIVWGKADAGAPNVDDRKKPLILNYNESSNENFMYSYAFIDANLMAPDKWNHEVIRSSYHLGRSDIFTTTDTEATTDLSLTFAPLYPVSIMGSKIGSYSAGGVWRYDNAEISWSNSFPDGITDITINTDVYRSSTDLPVTRFKLEMGNESHRGYLKKIYEQNWTPISAGAWDGEDANAASSDINNTTYTRVKFTHLGVSGDDELDWTAAGVYFSNVGLTNPPHVKRWNNVTNHVQLNLTLTNNTTGEAIQFNIPMLENDCLIIDCNPDAPTAKLNGQNVSGAIQLDTVRDVWMHLLGEANVFGYQCNLNSAFQVSIVTKWYNRMIYL